MAARWWVRASGGMLAVLVPAGARAQGFGVNEVGTCAIARGQAVTGAPCRDASVIYWNPAAGTLLQGLSIYAGISAISVDGSFTQDTSGHRYDGQVPTSYPPNVFVNYRRDRWAFGAGLYVPYGLAVGWGDDFPGRFEAKYARLASFYFQPNISFEIVPGQWSIGGGPVIGHSDVTLEQGADLAPQLIPEDLRVAAGLPEGATFALLGIRPGTEFARAHMNGSSTAWGFNIGVHGKPSPNLEVGARYLSKLTFKFDDASATFARIPTNLVIPADIRSSSGAVLIPAGTPVDSLLTPQFTPGTGILVPQGVTTTIPHPAQLQAGIGYRGFPLVLLSADYQYIWWSSFQQLPVNFTGPASVINRSLIEDYKNSWAIRAGVEIGLPSSYRIRGGFSYVASPAPDITVTPLLPDMDRYNYSLGLGVPLGDRFLLDAAYLRVETKGRRGRTVERSTLVNGDVTDANVLNSGFYTLNANIFSLSVRANF